jgi:hypothetical protein
MNMHVTVSAWTDGPIAVLVMLHSELCCIRCLCRLLHEVPARVLVVLVVLAELAAVLVEAAAAAGAAAADVDDSSMWHKTVPPPAQQ